MSSLKDIIEIFEKNPEEWIAYQFGIGLDRFKALLIGKPIFKGKILRFFLFVGYVFSKFSFKDKNKIREGSYFFYAETANQYRSLFPIYKSAIKKNLESDFIIDNGVKCEEHDKISVKFCFLDVLYSFSSMCFLIIPLLRRSHGFKKESNDWYFDRLCRSYIYVVYFYRLIKFKNPKCIFVSNDHNVASRSLVAVAHYLGIKTAYVQHASVSDCFPALNFDFAFLDGEFSLNEYKKCISIYELSEKKEVKIFLTGQKKDVHSDKKSKGFSIGVAINRLDDINEVIRFSSVLGTQGYLVKIRPHPRQSKEDLERLEKYLGNNENILLCSSETKVSSFFESVKCLVSGNSSIHLEASIAGVFSFYFEFSKQHGIFDYYGYVRNKLSTYVSSPYEIIDFINSGNLIINKDAVKLYTSTYDTPWFGNEGELCIKILEDIFNGDNWDSQFGAVRLNQNPTE